MFGKAFQLRPLELQKQLLVAESELSRAQLAGEWQVLVDEVHGFTDRARTVTAWTLAGALLVASSASLAVSRNGSVSAKAENPSWFQRVLKALQLANSMLSAFRAAFPQRPVQSA